MKKFIWFIPFILTLAACGGASDNPPNVAGNYSLTGTSCPRSLVDSNVEVHQNGNELIVEVEELDAAGNIDNAGQFSLNAPGMNCNGKYENDTVTADCTIEGVACRITYHKSAGSGQVPSAQPGGNDAQPPANTVVESPAENPGAGLQVPGYAPCPACENNAPPSNESAPASSPSLSVAPSHIPMTDELIPNNDVEIRPPLNYWNPNGVRYRDMEFEDSLL